MPMHSQRQKLHRGSARHILYVSEVLPRHLLETAQIDTNWNSKGIMVSIRQIPWNKTTRAGSAHWIEKERSRKKKADTDSDTLCLADSDSDSDDSDPGFVTGADSDSSDSDLIDPFAENNDMDDYSTPQGTPGSDVTRRASGSQYTQTTTRKSGRTKRAPDRLAYQSPKTVWSLGG